MTLHVYGVGCEEMTLTIDTRKRRQMSPNFSDFDASDGTHREYLECCNFSDIQKSPWALFGGPETKILNDQMIIE